MFYVNNSFIQEMQKVKAEGGANEVLPRHADCKTLMKMTTIEEHDRQIKDAKEKLNRKMLEMTEGKYSFDDVRRHLEE